MREAAGGPRDVGGGSVAEATRTAPESKRTGVAAGAATSRGAPQTTNGDSRKWHTAQSSAQWGASVAPDAMALAVWAWMCAPLLRRRAGE